jgi:hypothetical protein
MRKLVYQLCALCFLVCCAAQAQQKPCSQAEQDQVGNEAGSLRSWDALYKSYRQFRRCWNHADNVDADEGYSESIARILADHWETLPRLAQLIKKDAGFGTFAGLSATMNMDDVAKIRDKALHHCPAGLSGLCAKLKKEADMAIAEDAEVKKHN